jgi:glycosyltransferase involved in cell wall biosynthesis
MQRAEEEARCMRPMAERKTPIAVVVQRYGEEITGGSEYLARVVAERLAERHDVTVLTTCALDYVTWRNELPPGEQKLNGVRVLRFPTDQERDLAAFNAFAEPLYERPHDDEAEIEFLRRQGPFVPRLIEYLRQARGQFQAVAYFTYLYYPTYWGLRETQERSILIPTAHDEPALRLGIFTHVFTAPRAFVFCSHAEEAMVRERFDLGSRPTWVAGIGVSTPDPLPDVESFRIRYDVRGAYVLYAGRIDAGKGCAEMLDYYVQYRRRVRGSAELILIGRLAMKAPRIPGVRHLGFLRESEKLAAMAGARCLVCPSRYESLSIVLLEGFSLDTPALVNAASPVLLDHCRRSNAGLYYSNAEEFVEALDLLVREKDVRDALGGRGRRYVREQYAWPVVIDRYQRALATVMSEHAIRDERSTIDDHARWQRTAEKPFSRLK